MNIQITFKKSSSNRKDDTKLTSFPGVLLGCQLQHSGPGVSWGAFAIQWSTASMPLPCTASPGYCIYQKMLFSFLTWIPPLTLKLKHNAILLQCCLSNMSMFWTWQVCSSEICGHYDIAMWPERTELVSLKS